MEYLLIQARPSVKRKRHKESVNGVLYKYALKNELTIFAKELTKLIIVVFWNQVNSISSFVLFAIEKNHE